jgi:hypothetical protein
VPVPSHCGQSSTLIPMQSSAGQSAVALRGTHMAASSLINGKLRYALGELAALPRAAVVVEDRYSQVFKLDWVRPAVVADGLAELQIRWPSLPIVFSEAANSPRNGPTATSPPPTHGPAPNSPLPNAAAATRSNRRRQRLPARRRRQPAKSAHGHAAKKSPCPIVAGFAPTSGKHGATPSNSDHPSAVGWPGGLGLPGPAAYRTPGNQSLARLFIPLFP